MTKRQYFLSLTTSGKDLVDKYMDEYLKATAYLYEELGKEKSIELINLLKDATLILKEYEDKTKGDKLMKTVIITGSVRVLGFEMARHLRDFLRNSN